MREKECKGHSKVPSLVDMNDYAVEHNESFLFWGTFGWRS